MFTQIYSNMLLQPLQTHQCGDCLIKLKQTLLYIKKRQKSQSNLEWTEGRIYVRHAREAKSKASQNQVE